MEEQKNTQNTTQNSTNALKSGADSITKDLNKADSIESAKSIESNLNSSLTSQNTQEENQEEKQETPIFTGSEHLLAALADIDGLIALTQSDINDIKEANNDAVFGRMEVKNELVSSFMYKKEAYANAVSARMRELYPNASIGDLSLEQKNNLLGANAGEYTAKLHDKLFELKKLNHTFGRMALAVGEFYSSLLKKMLPSEEASDYKKSHLNSSFLQADA